MVKTMLAAMAALTVASHVAAAPATEIAFPKGRVYPESIAVDRAGYLYAGSAGDGTVWRAKPGDGAASAFIVPVAGGPVSVLGVFADDRAGLLYVCSIARRTDPEEVRDKASAI